MDYGFKADITIDPRGQDEFGEGWQFDVNVEIEFNVVRNCETGAREIEDVRVTLAKIEDNDYLDWACLGCETLYRKQINKELEYITDLSWGQPTRLDPRAYDTKQHIEEMCVEHLDLI